MGTHAQQKLEALTCRNKHGLNAAHDVFKVSRTTLYRWCKAHHEGRAVPCMTASGATGRRSAR